MTTDEYLKSRIDYWTKILGYVEGIRAALSEFDMTRLSEHG